MKNFMHSRRLALARAQRYRRCPPPDIGGDPLQAAYMKQHHAVCPDCGAAESSRLKIWDDLGLRLKEHLAVDREDHDSPVVSAGQLCFLKSELAGWHNGYYYNPPCVLLLETVTDIADEIFVAQVYHEIALAAPGDLILDDARSGVGDIFVECWNTYTLKSSYLGPVIGTVAPEIIEAVKSMENRPDSLPDWALLPKPLTEYDPRLYFRELETETGYVFASRAAAEILAELEKPQLNYESEVELQEDIRKSAKMISFPRPAAGFEEILASAKFPTDAYAKAAAQYDREAIPANQVVLQDGKVLAFKPIQGLVEFKTRSDSGLSISGAFPPMPDTARDPTMICFYWSRATGALPPEAMHWNASTGEFYITFAAAFQADEMLEFAMVYELNGE
ncbi:MAG: hypothetical protein GY850_09025 [bacterium]|nr:hypothetical protein [bacterium]